MPELRPRSKVWLEAGGDVALSEWRVELLEAVEAHGSLTAAAQALGVPFRTAWDRVREMESRLGIKLLDTQSGGPGGGHSVLTPEAREAIARFHRVVDGIAELVNQRFQEEFGQK
jgi:molybdate transport system regulatory protein